MTHEREIAGVGVVAGALLLIYQGEVTAAVALLGAIVGFFVGEKNGARSSTKNQGKD